MFLDHSELWIWRAVQGWERKTGDRTLAWQTEGPRFNTAKGKENCADVKHQCVRWVRKSQKGIKCRGDVMMQGQSREGSPGPSTSHSLRVSSTGLPHWRPQKLPQVPFQGKNKGKRYHKYYCDLSLLKRGQEKVLMLTRWPRSFVTSVTELYRGQRNWFWEVTKTSRRHIPSHMRKSNEILLYFWES